MKKSSFVPFDQVSLGDGFWHDRYLLNKEVSLNNVRRRFEESGRMDALRFNFLKTGKAPHIYYDSDVAKWIEAVAYLYAKDPDGMAEHIALCDELIDCMAAAQREDGYLNSTHQQIIPEKIFQDRGNHELYCAGHLMEAAVAYAQHTGKTKFLTVMEKCADCIEKAFMIEKTAAFVTPGHPEIELALFRMHAYTGKEKYARMAQFFLEERAGGKEPYVSLDNPFTSQDDTDIYHLSEANGHCVRALYFYAGIADLAAKKEDEALLSNLRCVFRDIIHKKMYLTGGVGSTYHCECFTVPYDLPNQTAYSESCAAIAFLMFATRMRKIDPDAVYGDLCERVLYNALLSSTSLDGKCFFYENPLEIALEEFDREKSTPKEWRYRMPIKERVEVFKTSCCPPNINRFFGGQLGSMIALEEDGGVTIEQYIAATVHTAYGALTLQGDYATEGKMTIFAEKYKGTALRLRLPAWCRSKVSAVLNGKPITPQTENGYMQISVGECFTLSLDFHIAPVACAANPKVRANLGRAALMYGPVVYCLEGVDNGSRLSQLEVDFDAMDRAKLSRDFHPLYTITLPAYRAKEDSRLYFLAGESALVPTEARFIPYYTFANRGESDMQVWVRRHLS